ncbi:MAG: CvpA family protein [Ignavibacteriaceae bacterium]
MSILDIIIFLILLAGFILGFKDGLVRKLIGLAGFILAVYLSLSLASEVGGFIEETFGIEFYLAEIMGGLIIFIFILLIFAVIKRVIHPFDRVNNIINQLLGGIIGTVQILFFVSAAFFLLNVFSVPDEESQKDSLLYRNVYNVIPVTIDYLSDYTPETKKIIKDYINDKDTL